MTEQETQHETQDEIAARGRAAVDPAVWRRPEKTGPLPPVPPWRPAVDVTAPAGDDQWTAIRELAEHELEAAGLTPDMVNAPPHYRGLPCGVEVIAITEHLTFSRGNAVKYLLRAGKKGTPETEIEDLRKAAWYASREADRLEIELNGAVW